MASSTNLAYNYKRSQQQQPKKAQSPDVKIISRPKKQHFLAKSVCFMLIVVSTLSALIYTKVVQSEISMQYNAAVDELNALKGENSRLQIIAEKEFSEDSIEHIARDELNMQKLDNSKIEYIQFNNKDNVEVIKKQTFFDNIKGWILGLFN